MTLLFAVFVSELNKIPSTVSAPRLNEEGSVFYLDNEAMTSSLPADYDAATDLPRGKQRPFHHLLSESGSTLIGGPEKGNDCKALAVGFCYFCIEVLCIFMPVTFLK